MKDRKNITGIILAGGKSSRMGTDKGLLLLNKKPFIQYSIDALKPLVSKILIVSDNPEYDIFGFTRIDDITKNAGPIAGICSGLEASSTEYNLILSCDVPLIKSIILKKLIEGVDNTSEIIQIEIKGKTMPLIALYKRDCKNVFCSLLDNGERRLRMAVNSCEFKNITIGIEHELLTMNVNTKHELKSIENDHNY